MERAPRRAPLAHDGPRLSYLRTVAGELGWIPAHPAPQRVRRDAVIEAKRLDERRRPAVADRPGDRCDGRVGADGQHCAVAHARAGDVLAHGGRPDLREDALEL